MKKTLIVMLSIIAVLFGFASCDNSASTPEGTAISNLGELKAAVAADGEYYLNADITLDGQLVISAPITLDGNNHKITATTPTTGDTAADKALILVTSDSVTLKNLTVSGTKTQETWNEGEYGIKVYDAENVTLEDIKIDKCQKAPISISSSTVAIDGLKADYSSWYTSANTIQVNGMGGSPVHQPSTVTFKSTEGIDAVWVEAVATNYENASAITDADFPKAGEHKQTVINGLSNWKVRYSDQPSKEVKGWMYYAPSQDASTFTLNADSKVAEKAEEDIRAMLTAIAESDPARKYSVIKLGQDIKLDAQLDIGIPVTIDGSDSKYTISLETVPSGAEDSEKSALFIKSSDVHLKNLTVSGPNTAPSGWDEGEYAIKAYGSYDGIPHQITNVTLENVKITGANAGMLVRGAAVTLNGTIDLENLEWGGIGVDSQGNEGGTPVTFDCDLSIASGCKISYTGTGSNAKPAIWTEHKDNSNETVIGAESIGLKEMAGPGDKSAQTWYVTDSYITQ